jgi:hypothetical protein
MTKHRPHEVHNYQSNDFPMLRIFYEISLLHINNNVPFNVISPQTVQRRLQHPILTLKENMWRRKVGYHAYLNTGKRTNRTRAHNMYKAINCTVLHAKRKTGLSYVSTHYNDEYMYICISIFNSLPINVKPQPKLQNHITSNSGSTMTI